MARRLSARGEAALAIFVIGPQEDALLARLGCAPQAPGSFGIRRLQLGEGLEEEALLVALPQGGYELHVHGGLRIQEHFEQILDLDPWDSPAPAVLEEDAHVRDALMAARVPQVVKLALSQRGDSGIEALLTRGEELRALGGALPAELRAELEQAHERGENALPYLEPPRVLLRGPQNSGKSTLFNLLLGRERVRSGPQAGLTRDSVEEHCVLGELPMCLVDSAGEGESEADVDAAAIELARAEERRAELVLWLEALPAAIGQQAAERFRGEGLQGASRLLRIWTHAGAAPEHAQERRARGELVLELVGEPMAARAQVRDRLLERLASAPCPERGACPLDARQRERLASLREGS
jgi:hypothetical protein